MRAAFGMLETATAPTIQDYPIDAPAEATAGEWACPVSFPVSNDQSLTERLVAEVTRLTPWSLETRTQRGRTLFGVTGAKVDQVALVAKALASIAESGDLAQAPEQGIEWKFEMPLLARHLADDLRTFYHEAIAAQPGPGAPNHDALNAWIFSGTALGDALQTIAEHLTTDGSPYAMLVRGLLIPEGHFKGGSAFPKSPEFGQKD
jgi:hypothetical protein